MATYSNQHWLLSHIRNSFVSTDDTGICETVMQSDDLPKHFLRKYQTEPLAHLNSQHRKSNGGGGSGSGNQKPNFIDRPLQEVDFVCYPGLDQSDDEDMDLSSQSFDIQMYPEVGTHRFRSNTAQRLEKMDIARRKAARTKCISFDDDIIPPVDNDFFVKKPVGSPKIETTTTNKKTESELSKAVKQDSSSAGNGNGDALEDSGIKSKLSQQLANSPKQSQNKFMEFARFDGTSLTGVQTKRINVFLNMLPERERNYPIKICVLSSAKILEVIGLVCYKATIQFPDIPLKSIRHYALYMTEDNDDMEDFPPLDNREPCAKFGFSHLTLAERRPLVPVTRIDYNNTLTKSTNSEEEKARLTADAVRSLQFIRLKGGNEEGGDEQDVQESPPVTTTTTMREQQEFHEATIGQFDMLEEYRTYRLNVIDKRFFKIEVTLGISSERIEIDQQNTKFWWKQKAVAYPIDLVAYCEITERRQAKATLRIYLKSSSSSSQPIDEMPRYSATTSGGGGDSSTALRPLSQMATSPFSFLHPSGSGSSSSDGGAGGRQSHMRFKHYNFEAPIDVAEHILNKLNCILEVRNSDVRREFLSARERKLEKHAKKQLKI